MGLGRNYVNNLIWSRFAGGSVLLGRSAAAVAASVATMMTRATVSSAAVSSADRSQAADAATAADAADSATDTAESASDWAQVDATARWSATQCTGDIAAADRAACIATSWRLLLRLVFDEVNLNGWEKTHKLAN